MEVRESPTASLCSLERVVRRVTSECWTPEEHASHRRGNDGRCRRESLNEAGDVPGRQTAATKRTGTDAATKANENQRAFHQQNGEEERLTSQAQRRREKEQPQRQEQNRRSLQRRVRLWQPSCPADVRRRPLLRARLNQGWPGGPSTRRAAQPESGLAVRHHQAARRQAPGTTHRRGSDGHCRRDGRRAWPARIEPPADGRPPVISGRNRPAPSRATFCRLTTQAQRRRARRQAKNRGRQSRRSLERLVRRHGTGGSLATFSARPKRRGKPGTPASQLSPVRSSTWQESVSRPESWNFVTASPAHRSLSV